MKKFYVIILALAIPGLVNAADTPWQSEQYKKFIDNVKKQARENNYYAIQDLKEELKNLLQETDPEGMSLLMHEAFRGSNRNALPLLIKYSDVHAKDKQGRTALAHALRGAAQKADHTECEKNRFIDTVKQLLAAGAEIPANSDELLLKISDITLRDDMDPDYQQTLLATKPKK